MGRSMHCFAASVLAAVLFFHSVIVYPVCAEENKLPSGLPWNDLEITIDSYVKEHQKTTAGMECAVFDREHVIFQKEYGYVNKEKQLALHKDSVLDWGSITKLLVWVSAMQLWERGELDLERDVREYLPEGFLDGLRYDTPITMIDLMNHQGGFQEHLTDIYFQDYEKVLPLKEQLQKTMPVQVFEPGSVTAYSNWGSALAGYVVSCISGQSFDAYVKEHIFEPLGMKDTAIRPDLSDREGMMEKRSELQGYWASGKRRELSFMYVSLYPCGMCVGTLSDLVVFAQALIPAAGTSSPLFQKEETLEQMLSPTSYIGDSKNARNCHGLLVTYFGVPVVGHGGNSYTCSSQLCIDLESGIGTVVMTNQYEEEVYTKQMMPLIYGSYDTSSNLGMPVSSEEQYVVMAGTIWEGPFSILRMALKTFYTAPPDNTPYMLLEEEGRIEFGDITDMVIISPTAFYLDTILILLLPFIGLYIILTAVIPALIIQPVRRLCHRRNKTDTSPNMTAGWHYICGIIIMLWIANVINIIYQIALINPPSEYYLWCMGLNAVLGALMIVALIWLLVNRKKLKAANRKLFWKAAPVITGFCLLVSIAVILRFQMYQFWRI